MHVQPGFQVAMKQEVMGCLKEKTSLSQEVTEKSHRGLSIIYCPGSRPLSLLGLFVEDREGDGGEDSRHRGRQSPSHPSLCLPNWAAGQIHWTGEGRRVHKARAQLV